MTFLCLSGILGSAADKMPVTPIREAAGFVIIPFQNGINQIGAYLTDCLTGFQNVKKLSAEKEELEQKVTDLTEENNQLVQDQQELQRLQELYQLDQSYSEYEKVAAQVISKDPGNWYDTFVINKGSNDGIQKDMNVIADGGLVGLVEEVSSNSATVRSIIDDSSSVSAMTASTSDTCIVSGDLRLISDGKLAFSQLNTTDTVAEGEKIVTSNISDKYLGLQSPDEKGIHHSCCGFSTYSGSSRDQRIKTAGRRVNAQKNHACLSDSGSFPVTDNCISVFSDRVRNAEPSSDSDVRLWVDARKKRGTDGRIFQRSDD